MEHRRHPGSRRSRPRSMSSTPQLAPDPRHSRSALELERGRSRAPTPAGRDPSPDGRACESLVGDLVTDAIRSAVQHRFRDHQLGRPPGRPDLPDRSDRVRRLLPASLIRSRPRQLTRSRAARSWASCRSATCPRPPTINGAELKDLPRNGCVVAAGDRQRPLRPGLRPVLHVRHRGRRADLQADGTGNPGTGSRVTRSSGRPPTAPATSDGAAVGFSAGDHYTLTINDFTADRRRRLSELPQTA